jgi:hypothetical protein
MVLIVFKYCHQKVNRNPQVNMIRYNLYGVNPVSLLLANISEYQLAILFNLPVAEYFVSILGHQRDVVGDLTVAMAKAVQFQAYHILAIGVWHRPWLRRQVQHHLKRSNVLSI